MGAPVTQDEPRTAKATRAAQLAAQHKRAAYLIDRGWICIAPDVDLESVLPVVQPWAARGVLGLLFGKKGA
jgi:hypothetical protein